MAMVGQMLKPKKTEITEKLRQEINKVGAARRKLTEIPHGPQSRPWMQYQWLVSRGQ